MKPEIAGTLMTDFIEIDGPGASNWFSEHWNEIPLDRKDHVAASVTTYAVEQGELENARAWLSEITDENIRRQVETEVAVAELRASRKKGE